MDRVLPDSPMVREAARNAGLPVPLVSAIVEIESSGQVYAYNPEPHYRYLWDVRNNAPFRKLTPHDVRSERPPVDFPSHAGVPKDAEWWGQQASYGLMQIMGALARELGFDEPWLGRLYDPWLNLELGCRHLARQIARYRGSHLKAVAAYNAGSARVVDESGKFVNQDYVDKVVAAAGGYGYWISKSQDSA